MSMSYWAWILSTRVKSQAWGHASNPTVEEAEIEGSLKLSGQLEALSQKGSVEWPEEETWCWPLVPHQSACTRAYTHAPHNAYTKSYLPKPATFNASSYLICEISQEPIMSWQPLTDQNRYSQGTRPLLFWLNLPRSRYLPGLPGRETTWETAGNNASPPSWS